MTIDVAARLEAAAALIERDGWFQTTLMGGHDFQEGISPNCAVTALYSAKIGGTLNYLQCADEARLEMLTYTGVDALPRWNNAPGQTKENVIATMRACAAIWRAKNSRSAAPALGVESEPAQVREPVASMGMTGEQGAPTHA